MVRVDVRCEPFKDRPDFHAAAEATDILSTTLFRDAKEVALKVEFEDLKPILTPETKLLDCTFSFFLSTLTHKSSNKLMQGFLCGNLIARDFAFYSAMEADKSRGNRLDGP